MRGKKHIRKLKLSSHICKRYTKKMFLEFSCELARRVLLWTKSQKEKKYIQKIETSQKFNCNWQAMRNLELMDYTRKRDRQYA